MSKPNPVFLLQADDCSGQGHSELNRNNSSQDLVEHQGFNNVSELRVRQKLMWRQWRRAHNYIRSIETYQDLSPDLSIRQQVNQSLQQRPPLSPEDWCAQFKPDTQAQCQTLLFIYRSLEDHSGLEFNRVRPHDRLVEDLQFPLVCWFDWANRFCDDVSHHLSIDISDCFDETQIHTLAELATFLETCLTNPSA